MKRKQPVSTNIYYLESQGYSTQAGIVLR